MFNDLLKYLDTANVIWVLKFFRRTIFNPACDTRTEGTIAHVGYQMQQLVLTSA